MTTKSKTYQLPPEWAPQKAVMLAWPHDGTDWAYMLPWVQECFVEIIAQISRFAHVVVLAPDIEEPTRLIEQRVQPELVHFLQIPTNDTWARDFGPISTIDADGNIIANDFRFNGWGLKFAADKDNCINMRLWKDASHPIVSSPYAKYAMMQQLVLEGGSIDVDDEGTLLTTSECLLSPNRNPWLSKQEIEQILIQRFGLERMVWLDHGSLEGDDTDSHIDTLARFLPGKKIACATCDRTDDAHYLPLAEMRSEISQKLPEYEIVDLPIPDAIYDADGARLPATYANFLIINGAVMLPIYGNALYDGMAIKALSTALPGYEIVPIDCRALIQQHGSLHCVTMQLPFMLDYAEQKNA